MEPEAGGLMGAKQMEIQSRIAKGHVHRSFFVRTIAAQLHLIGTLGALVGLILLLHYAISKDDHSHLYACLVFGLTGILVFTVSTVYHFMHDGFSISPQLEAKMEDLDHFAIFMFIAGTYTPLILNATSAPWTGILLWTIWSVGIFGVIYTQFKQRLPIWAQSRLVYTSLFVAMGWVFIIRVQELLSNLTHAQAYNLLAGGVCYSVGAIVYALKRPNPFPTIFGFHEIWHLMVLFGFAFHYVMIFEFYH
jgi:hemolysin III